MYMKTAFADAPDLCKTVSGVLQTTLFALVAKFNFKLKTTGLSNTGELCQ